MGTLTYSEFIAAAKSRERTAQYHILAALYVLGATTTPVSVIQISRLLQANLPKPKLPADVNGSLRQYVGLVESRATEPRTWVLTPVGLAKLQKMCGLPLATNATSTDFGVDVGLVCALHSPELTAFKSVCGDSVNWKEEPANGFTHVYESCALETERGRRLTVVASTQTTMGLTSAAILTTQLIMRYRPRLVVMVGIAAGTRAGGKQFGDVLVADPSIDYNSGKLVDDNGTQRLQPDPHPVGIAKRIRAVLLRYSQDTELFDGFRDNWKGKTPEMPNRLHVGAVGAADQVIDNPDKIKEIQLSWRKLIGLEMETYGVYRACEESPAPSPRHVAFKAVCDFGEKKTDDWQEYAAFMAASFAVYFLRSHWEEVMDHEGVD